MKTALANACAVEYAVLALSRTAGRYCGSERN